jgi:hypothetical protein
MKLKNVIGIIVLIFVFIIACAGTSEQSGTEQLSEEDLSFNPNEPWTGIWKVTGSTGLRIRGTYELRLKQNGNQVKSLKGSSYEFKGNAVENRLKGRFKDDDHQFMHLINVKISEDLKSFEGTDRSPAGRLRDPLKGVRQD